MEDDPGWNARRRQVEAAEHNGRMEGREISAATRELAEEYISGGFDADELVAKVKERYRHG
ncbi:hypothetical protein COCCU_01175 [Corynebacterium occultum]|uniref:Antitoxin VbhA domain-containing protein n=1 Tax=Corynebacterium occultum TaxID=2675219 RepID=A0A6B8VQ25_9CORY|nr:hypothetical protein [Corynebacterium occultum]QGU06203.1 hypothetical protein COCCU_01175 [Corynebacterium occultum]